jgi:GNAT superfamily N-acetyltransferase
MEKIRQLEKRDYPELVSMFKEFATFQKMTDKMVNTVELMEKESDILNAYVVESENGELVGYATYFYAYYTWIGKSMYMDDLYVKPDSRGKGLGQKLINSIIDKAKKDNCKKVHWQVSSWNKNAIEFYKNIGAKIDDVESNCDYWLIEI